MDADILVLALNPGFSQGDAAVHSTPVYQRLWRSNIAQTIDDFPLFLIHPDLKDTPCHAWWTKNLRHIIGLFGERHVAQSILAVQLFPYHSRAFKCPKERLPSQEFSVRLVRSAIQRSATIIIMRSRAIWEKYLPELATYRYVFQLRNPRNVVLSPNNFVSGFESVVEAIRRASTH